MTNCASCFQPWLVLVVDVSGKYPSIWTPGTPLGVGRFLGVRPAQSAGSVWPEATVPAVVSLQARDLLVRCPGTRSELGQSAFCSRAAAAATQPSSASV